MRRDANTYSYVDVVFVVADKKKINEEEEKKKKNINKRVRQSQTKQTNEILSEPFSAAHPPFTLVTSLRKLKRRNGQI